MASQVSMEWLSFIVASRNYYFHDRHG
jgi:hypothetical protein